MITAIEKSLLKQPTSLQTTLVVVLFVTTPLVIKHGRLLLQNVREDNEMKH